MKKFVLLCGLVLILIVCAAVPGYHVIKKLQIGGDGFWDYLIVDDAARRLYVSHSTQVVVIDLGTDTIVGEINDTPGVHGIALAPELNRGFISCGRANTAIIFDLKTLKVLGEVKTGTNPDAIRYDAATRQVFVYNGRSNDATVFDAATGEITGTIPLRLSKNQMIFQFICLVKFFKPFLFTHIYSNHLESLIRIPENSFPSSIYANPAPKFTIFSML
jgi:hypothetical protein